MFAAVCPWCEICWFLVVVVAAAGVAQVLAENAIVLVVLVLVFVLFCLVL